MIKSFRRKELARFFSTGSVRGIDPAHASRIRLQLAALDTARSIQDMDLPGYRLHLLKGRRYGSWSIRVSANWRLTFRFAGGNAFDIDYEDYH